MPRHTEKHPRTSGNKMLTRAAAAAAAASVCAEAAASACAASSSRPTTPTDSCPPRPEPPSSPAKCAICLGDLANRCYTNSCIHQFCFGCLLEWSKIKAECPLCKSNFQSIYHNIRSNDDYDEYHIPATNSIPHLSIRLTNDGYHTFVNNGPITIPTFRYNDPLPIPPPPVPHFMPMGPTSPFHDHGYSFQRMVRERERSERNSYIRILEVGPVSEPSALDFMNYSSGGSASGGRQALDNPFYEEESELFGAINDSESAAAGDPALRGYTNRKRIYDRGQFVSPFQGTLPAGTVFFPSVEYFRTHPSSFARVKAWLYREIMVLMGIHRSRTEMGYVFDVILGLLLRYDIRSREFREMINVYMGVRTRQFQHEFYHFLLAGMHMEEYDRVARYTNPSTSTTVTSTAATSSSTLTTAATSSAPSASRAHSSGPGSFRTETSMPRPITVVTISDSSDADSDTDSVETLDVGETSNPQNARGADAAAALPTPAGPAEQEVPDCPVSASGLRLSSGVPLGNLLTEERSSDTRNQFRDAYELGFGGRRVDSRVLSPPFSPPLSPRSDWSWTSGIRIPPPQPPRAHTGTSGLSISSGLDLDGWESAINNLSRYRPVREPRSNAALDDFSDPVNITTTLSHRFRDSDALLHGTPSLDLHRPRCPVETGYPTVSSFVEATATRPERSRRHLATTTCLYPDPSRYNFGQVPNPAPGSPGYIRRVSSHADPVTNMNPDGTPRRSTPYSLEIPDNIVLSDALKKLRAGRSNPPPAPAPPPEPEDDDEIEMLGIHPVVKPPPLAVITLSSDDEDGNPKKSKPKVEKQESSTFTSAAMAGVAASSSATVRSDEDDTESEASAALLRNLDVVFELAIVTDTSSPVTRSSPAAAQNFKEWVAPTRFVGPGLRCRLRRKGESLPPSKLAKKPRYISPELLSSSHDGSSDSSSDSSDSDVYVEEVVERKTKRKQRKVKKTSRSSKHKSPTETPGSSHKSGSGKKKSHRRLKKCPPPPPSLSGTHKSPEQGRSSVIFAAQAPSSSTSTITTKVTRLISSDSSDEEEPTTRLLTPFKSSPTYTGQPLETTVATLASSGTLPGVGILDLRKLMEERKGPKKTRAPGCTAMVMTLPEHHSRWESDQDVEVNEYTSGDERNLSEGRDHHDHDGVLDMVGGTDSDSSSTSSDTRFHSRESGGMSAEDGRGRGSFFIPNPITPPSRSYIREPMLGQFFGTPQSGSLEPPGAGLLDFPMEDTVDDSPPWRFGQMPPSESAAEELLDLSISSLHSPGHYEEALNQRHSTTDGGSWSDSYSSSNEHAWLGDY